MTLLNEGDRILVRADPVLGTDAAWGTIVSVKPKFYVVRIDGDDPEWAGPVSFDGEVLCEAC